MPIWAWIDDAGTKNTDAVFVLAGFIDRAESWLRFSDEWRDCLDQHPKLDYFKMYEAQGLCGQFANWTKEARDLKLRALVDVIKKHGARSEDCRAIYFTTPFSIFEQRVTVDLKKPFTAAYFWGLLLLMVGVHADLGMRGIKEEFEVIFDEHKIFGTRAQVLYPLVHDVIQQRLGITLPQSPLFRDDHKFMPLQMSDMLAWLLRRTWNGQRNEFSWMLDELASAIKISTHSLILCHHNIDLFMATKRIPLPISISEETMTQWAREVGVDVNELLVSQQWRNDGRSKRSSEESSIDSQTQSSGEESGQDVETETGRTESSTHAEAESGWPQSSGNKKG